MLQESPLPHPGSFKIWKRGWSLETRLLFQHRYLQMSVFSATYGVQEFRTVPWFKVKAISSNAFAAQRLVSSKGGTAPDIDPKILPQKKDP